MNMLFLTLVILSQAGAHTFSERNLRLAPNVKSEVDNEKADFKHLRMVADIEDSEAHKEEAAARNDELDGEAIEKAAASTAKTELDRASKYLPTGKDRDAAVAAAHGEEAQKDTDAKQMEDVAAKEKKDAADTEKDVTRMRQDAAAIEAIVMPAKAVVLAAVVESEIENEKADFKHLRMVADIEDAEAHKEEAAARNDEWDGEAIEWAASKVAKTELDRATKYLPNGKDRDAAFAAAHGEEAQKDTDAKQMEDVAAKEKKDAADTERDVTRMRQDAAAIEAIVMPAKAVVMSEIDNEKADFKHLRKVADIEEAEAHKEEAAARNDELDGEAIEKAAATTAKTELDRATKYLPSGKDRDAAFAAAHGEEAQKDTDAKQMEDVAAKEKKDAADTEKDVTRMRQDAAAIEAIVMPAKAVMLAELAEAPETKSAFSRLGSSRQTVANVFNLAATGKTAEGFESMGRRRRRRKEHKSSAQGFPALVVSAFVTLAAGVLV